MARLRKPNQNEPTIFAAPSETRATRMSPRKVTRELRYTPPTESENSMLVPKSSRRELRYTQDSEDSFLVPKTPIVADALTPRKQRILRPVQSNSRLLRKLSDESLASPEKKQRDRRVRSGTMDTDVGKRERLMYAKSLAKSVVKKQANKAKIDVVGTVEMDESMQQPTSQESNRTEEHVDVDVDVDVDVEMDEEVDTSLWCGEENDSSQDKKEPHAEETSDEDEDPIVTTRQRRQQPWSRHIASDSESDEDEMLVDDSDSYDQGTSFKVPERTLVIPSKEELLPFQSMPPPSKRGNGTTPNWGRDIIDLTHSPAPNTAFEVSVHSRTRTAPLTSSRPNSSKSNDALAILTYSPTPTKFRSPRKAPPISRPSTPPLAPPSPSKLISPSKRKPALPKDSHLDGRPSLDAFWNPEAVNGWNETHLPSKLLVSPRKQKWRDDVVKMMEGISLDDSNDDGYASPTTSPRKKNTMTGSKSPSKKTSPKDEEELDAKALRAQRKDFTARRHALAESFLAELDTTICGGRIASECQSTGGIKLIWSKTLKTTAGRATWRREQVRVRDATLAPPHNTSLLIRHHCAIELAEKVIDSEHRLYNVLAHEFCHLTTFIIDGVRNNPHGAAFKAWGAKASHAFKHKDVQVTTKHSYEIEYKYIWECVACGIEFKRHSKSIDTVRHSCGKCRGKLVQTRPVPRGTGGKGPAAAAAAGTNQLQGSDAKSSAGQQLQEKKKSEYQLFVKQNFARLKKELISRGEKGDLPRVMEVVAREYREGKEKATKGGEVVAVAVAVVVIEDDVDSVDIDDIGLALGGLKI